MPSRSAAVDAVPTERFAGQQGFSRRAPRQPKPRSATAAAIPSSGETNQTSCPSRETLLAGVPLDVRERIRIGAGPSSGTTPTTNAIRALSIHADGPFGVHLVFLGGGGARGAMLAPLRRRAGAPSIDGSGRIVPFRADWTVETPLDWGIVGYGGPGRRTATNGRFRAHGRLCA